MARGRLSFVLLALAGAAFVGLTMRRLPDPLAVHFGLRGDPDGWAGHGTYRAVLALIGFVLPVALVLMVSRLAATSPESLNVPGKEYWFHPERRAEGVRRVTDQMWWLGCLMLALALGVHGLLLAANAMIPPRLPTVAFVALLAGFLLGLVVWTRSLHAALRPPVG